MEGGVGGLAPVDHRMSVTALGDELGSGEEDPAVLPGEGGIA